MHVSMGFSVRYKCFDYNYTGTVLYHHVNTCILLCVVKDSSIQCLARCKKHKVGLVFVRPLQPITLLKIQTQSEEPSLRDLWVMGKSSIRIEVLEECLHEYLNKEVAGELLTGFSNSFILHYTCPRVGCDSNNLLSVTEHLVEPKSKLEK